jgi:hypothetical protein
LALPGAAPAHANHLAGVGAIGEPDVVRNPNILGFDRDDARADRRRIGRQHADPGGAGDEPIMRAADIGLDRDRAGFRNAGEKPIVILHRRYLVGELQDDAKALQVRLGFRAPSVTSTACVASAPRLFI